MNHIADCVVAFQPMSRRILHFLLLTLLPVSLVFSAPGFRKEIIGVSVENRPIYIFCFGNQEKKTLLFVGGQHGNEQTSVDTLYAFRDYLAANPQARPRHLQVCIIPALNADGVARNERNNANGVDLNRNFKTIDWQAKTYTNRKEIPFGGGRHALSEPESMAIANLLSERHKNIVAFVNVHCCGAMALPNSRSLLAVKMAAIFRQRVKYRTLHTSWSNAVYKVTGTISDFTWENYRIPDIFIELERKDKHPFKTILPGLLAVIRSDIYHSIKKETPSNK